MERTLINEFREKVNEQQLVFKMYHNRHGKNQWGIICSAMDWIAVVVDSIETDNLTSGNSNESSIKVMTFVMCIDVLWEAIQQLHRVFFSTKEVPFAKDNSTFKHKLFAATDNHYFKTIRACFAVHPINLSDNFSGDGLEQRYASWSGDGLGVGDFYVILYSNNPDKEAVFLHIYFNELLTFANDRYNHLRTIMKEIDKQVEQYFELWRSRKITRVSGAVEQIEILINEAKQRLDNGYYNHELEKLKTIFTTSITSSKNHELVDRYRIALSDKIESLFTCLQQMNTSELKSVDDACSSDCQFAFSKLSEVVFSNGNPAFITIEKFQEHLSGIVDFSDFETWQELYVIIRAGFFTMNECGQRV